MKVLLSWLAEYVDISGFSPKELADKLTFSGLQVESVETIGREELPDTFIVAEVVECVPHPDSDHLHVCKVFDGAETLQIVCGAPNCRAGLKTALAKIGAVVPDGGFKIKKGKLRGVESFGMLCSAKELKIGEGNDGIIEFPQDAKAGTPVRDMVKAEKPEVVFDIEVTWNRPDALSVIGIAREFSAILGRPLKMPAVDIVEDASVNAADVVSVEVKDAVKCPRYTARIITKVKDGPSPEIMAKRLELCDVRSLGLIVDVTNYVMLECGQPLHAFDYKTLAGGKIVVRNAAPGETIKTLDGVERKLDTDMLLICDGEKPSAIAGVMGGEGSEIAQGTGSVLIESALFDCAAVKNSSSKAGLSTEASYRYIRGVDLDIADWASRRAAHLLQKYGEAVIAKGVVDVDGRPAPLQADVAIVFDNARRKIGVDIPDEKISGILQSLGFILKSCTDGKAVFGVPSWRRDIELEADLIEEVARMYGLDAIPDTMPSAPSVSPLSDAEYRAKIKVSDTCLALGFTEAMHYSYLSEKELDDFNPADRAARLALPDPVSKDFAVLRPSLLPQMLSSLGRNAANKLETVSFFEIGRVFIKGADGKPGEETRLALGMAGPAGRPALDRRRAVSAEEAVLWMKGALGEIIGATRAGRMELKPAEFAAFSPGAAFEIILNGRSVGMLGAVNKKLRHPYRVTTQIVLAELKLAPLLKHAGDTGRAVPAPVYPPVFRDVAFTAGPETTHEKVVKCIRAAASKELEEIKLFDIFESKALGGGKRSFAYSLAFRAADRTLTDEEVNRAFASVVEALKNTQKVDVREGGASSV